MALEVDIIAGVAVLRAASPYFRTFIADFSYFFRYSAPRRLACWCLALIKLIELRDITKIGDAKARVLALQESETKPRKHPLSRTSRAKK